MKFFKFFYKTNSAQRLLTQVLIAGVGSLQVIGRVRGKVPKAG